MGNTAEEIYEEWYQVFKNSTRISRFECMINAMEEYALAYHNLKSDENRLNENRVIEILHQHDWNEGAPINRFLDCSCYELFAKAICSLTAPQGTWISVYKKDQRMPDLKCIAINNQGQILIGYLEVTNFNVVICKNEDVRLTGVTHWVPLPSPPNNP